MEFPVPQFIEIEEKILGPLNFRQVIYIVGAAGILFIFYFFLKFWLFIILAIVIMGTACAFAFIKIGGKGLGNFLASVLTYAFAPRFFVWKKTEKKELPEKIQLIKPKAPTLEEEAGLAPQKKTGLQVISRKIDLGIGQKHPSAEEPNQIPKI